MRYGKNENTILVGKLPSGGTVTIRVLQLSTDMLLGLTSDVCTESTQIPGTYLWSTDKITGAKADMDCMYEMTDGNKIFYGKFVYGGRVDEVEPAIEAAKVELMNRVGQVENDIFSHSE